MLNPNVSIPTAAGLAGLVVGIHALATPNEVDTRTSMPGTIPHMNVNKTRRTATWISAIAVSGISLLAKDPKLMIVGGGMVIGMDWWTRYDNEVFPAVGRLLGVEEQAAVAADVSASQGNNVVNLSPYADAAY
jgi:hypothetical protein